MKNSEVCIKTRFLPASLPSQGQVTEHTTAKWLIPSPHPLPYPSLTTFFGVILVTFELVLLVLVTLFWLVILTVTVGFSTTTGTRGAVFNWRSSSCLCIPNVGAGIGLKLSVTWGSVLRNWTIKSWFKRPLNTQYFSPPNFLRVWLDYHWKKRSVCTAENTCSIHSYKPYNVIFLIYISRDWKLMTFHANQMKQWTWVHETFRNFGSVDLAAICQDNSQKKIIGKVNCIFWRKKT